ncbi:HlyD family efflux transporter periplasmic adaptor subunit [Pedobacter sp. NJ-S-72]
MSIIPDFSGNYGIATMPSTGIGKVKKGQKVFITFDGYPQNEFGSVVGKVSSISSVQYKGAYLIKINMPDGLLSTYNKKITGQQEMNGTANIVTSDLKLIDRIFNGIRSVFLNK